MCSSDLDKAAETPLGMTPWSATGQGHDCDEAAGGEAGDAIVLPASPEEVYAAMGVDERIAMRKDFDRKGLVRPDEFEDFLWNGGPDPLLLAITRRWEERERRKRSEAAILESAGEEGLAPGTIQACRARGARMGRVHSAVRQGPSRKALEGAHPRLFRPTRPGSMSVMGIFRQLPDAEGGRSAESCSALPFSRGLRRPGQAASFSFPCDFGAAVWPVFREG